MASLRPQRASHPTSWLPESGDWNWCECSHLRVATCCSRSCWFLRMLSPGAQGSFCTRTGGPGAQGELVGERRPRVEVGPSALALHAQGLTGVPSTTQSELPSSGVGKAVTDCCWLPRLKATSCECSRNLVATCASLIVLPHVTWARTQGSKQRKDPAGGAPHGARTSFSKPGLARTLPLQSDTQDLELAVASATARICGDCGRVLEEPGSRRSPNEHLAPHSVLLVASWLARRPAHWRLGGCVLHSLEGCLTPRRASTPAPAPAPTLSPRCGCTIGGPLEAAGGAAFSCACCGRGHCTSVSRSHGRDGPHRVQHHACRRSGLAPQMAAAEETPVCSCASRPRRAHQKDGQHAAWSGRARR